MLGYFALQGYANSLASSDFSVEARARQNDAYDRARQGKEHPQVRQWWERVDKFKTALRKSKIEQLEQEIARIGYETGSVSWSNSGWHLYVLLRDAIRLGAPLSVQVELTEPLLGTFPDDYDELEERLRLNLGKPGEWLARRVENGDIFRGRTSGLFPDYMQAGGAERRSGVERASQLLFPAPNGGSYDAEGVGNSLSHPTHLGPRLGATLHVLEDAAEILLVADIPRALDVITKARRIRDASVVVEAAAGISHVCEWLQVRELLLELSKSTLVRDFRREAQRFPWEHWTVCDEFLGDDKHGTELLRELASDLSSFDRTFVGWALRSVLVKAPDNDAIIKICAQFAQQAMRDEDPHGRESDREQIAAFAAISKRFCDQNPDVVRRLDGLLQSDDDLARGILLQSPLASPLRAEARKSLLRSAPSRGTIHERVTFATLDESQRPIEWQQVHVELVKSWKGLTALAPVLHARYWTAQGWQALWDALRVGGHRGKTASWRLQRVKLAIDALDNDESSEALFDESKNGLAFLRSAIIDGVGSGDATLANNAVYGLVVLARRTEQQVDAAELAAALRAAADDVRIGVAHGAAFVANYLLAYGAAGGLHAQVVEAAEEVRRQMSDDPLAIIRRQAEFGSKQGARDAAKRRLTDNNDQNG